MSLGLIGKKVGMTRIYTEKGESLPVTVIEVAANEVVQIKKKETDGYSSVQLGFKDKKDSRVNKPLLGHFKKHGVTPKYVLREFRLEEDKLPAAGTKFGAELFKKGSFVDVTGTTKGKGFQGVMKRFGFRGQPATHGSMMHRRPGSIGCRSTPGLVSKNKKLPGHHGGDRRTVLGLEVIQSRPEDGVVLIRGSVPGANGGYVIVRPTVKAKHAGKGE